MARSGAELRRYAMICNVPSEAEGGRLNVDLCMHTSIDVS